LQKYCRESNDKEKSLCGRLNKWVTSSDYFVLLLKEIPKMSSLPENGWLSDDDLNKFMVMFRNIFPCFMTF